MLFEIRVDGNISATITREKRRIDYQFRGEPDAGFLRPGVSLAVLATSALSWRYVKDSNRAAARALQQEIDAPATPA